MTHSIFSKNVGPFYIEMHKPCKHLLKVSWGLYAHAELTLTLRKPMLSVRRHLLSTHMHLGLVSAIIVISMYFFVCTSLAFLYTLDA